jgi:hypothetical protein
MKGLFKPKLIPLFVMVVLLVGAITGSLLGPPVLSHAAGPNSDPDSVTRCNTWPYC